MRYICILLGVLAASALPSVRNQHHPLMAPNYCPACRSVGYSTANLSPAVKAWEDLFGRDTLLDQGTDNRAYVDLDNEGSGSETVIRHFMRHDDESKLCCPSANVTEAFCGDANLDCLWAGGGLSAESSEPRTALVDECNLRTPDGEGRSKQSLMNARELYGHLKKPV